VCEEHLRAHPLFVPLPREGDGGLGDDVPFRTPADVRRVPQHTSLWDALHTRRLTTSRLAAVLGFFEPAAAACLGVPKSLTGHGKAVAAAQHLWDEEGADPIDSLLGMFSVLDGGSSGGGGQALVARLGVEALRPADVEAAVEPAAWQSHASRERALWAIQTPTDEQGAMQHRYAYNPPPGTSHRVRLPRGGGLSSVRMAWGGAQESVGLLAALNALVGPAAPLSRLYECGLCVGECVPLPGGHVGALPTLGASPDGVLLYGDGTVEAVEVKCHAPFAESRQSRAAFCVDDRGPVATIGAWHVPQLQFEAYCLGPHCTGTNFVSLSATRGARIFWVPRDDAYIARMLAFVAHFQANYVEARTTPPRDFHAGDAKHAALLAATLAIAAAARVRADVPDASVQRAGADRFFLDRPRQQARGLSRG
jgi:hypothetical protein